MSKRRRRKASAPSTKEPMTRGDCGCRNHMGNAKNKYPTHGAALTAILRRHLRDGAHHTYECPRMPGVWHVGGQQTNRQENPR